MNPPKCPLVIFCIIFSNLLPYFYGPIYKNIFIIGLVKRALRTLLCPIIADIGQAVLEPNQRPYVRSPAHVLHVALKQMT